MCESQERMMAVVAPGQLDEFLAITDRWDVEAIVLGEVTDGSRLEIFWHGELIVDVAAALGRPRRPGLRAAGDPPGLARRAAGGRRRSGWPGRRPATSCGDRCCASSPHPTSATSRG